MSPDTSVLLKLSTRTREVSERLVMSESREKGFKVVSQRTNKVPGMLKNRRR